MGAGKAILRYIGYGFGIAMIIMGALCLAGGIVAALDGWKSSGC